MIIGITGKIGSGKSTVTELFATQGWVVIDADKIGKQVVQQNKSVLKKLVAHFGDDILTAKKNLNRKKLREKAFQSKSSVKALNKIVHPYLLEELFQQIKKLSLKNKDILIDAALLLDWKLDKNIDAVIVVHANQNIRINRMLNRGFSKKDILEIDVQQKPFLEFRKKADYLIYNSGTNKELIQKVKEL